MIPPAGTPCFQGVRKDLIVKRLASVEGLVLRTYAGARHAEEPELQATSTSASC
jgi:hypothetical protein